MTRFDGKVVLVNGLGETLGRAVTNAFTDAGAMVVVDGSVSDALRTHGRLDVLVQGNQQQDLVPSALPHLHRTQGCVVLLDADARDVARRALDFARSDVRVNAVTVNLASDCPLGRNGEAHEFAAAITFLASEAASFITGVTLPVDGGRSALTERPTN